MEAPERISTAPPQLNSQNFEFLREEAMKMLRKIASQTWTDHNLHDPGITLLEMFCYALTEMGLRAGMDIKDLMASDVSGYNQSLYEAAEILPVAPVTVKDIRSVLIDHPLLSNAWLHHVKVRPFGRYRILLEFLENRLNSNTYGVTTEPAALSGEYQIDVAFPHWDDEEVDSFTEDLTFLSIDIDTPAGDEWSPLSGNLSFYSRVTVTHQNQNGEIGNSDLWIIATINSIMDNPATEAPLILNDLLILITEIGDNSPTDESLLRRFNRRVRDAHTAQNTVKHYIRDYRNLCEYFIGFRAARLQEIAVSAIIDVNTGVQVEEVLADIFLNIDNHISPGITFKAYNELDRNFTNDRIFEGPLLDSGFIPAGFVGDRIHKTLYTSDILNLILKTREQSFHQADIENRTESHNIIAVRNLTLANFLDNRPVTTRAKDCLRLIESQRHIPRLSLTKSQITVYRNGIEIGYDIAEVIRRFNEKKEKLAELVIPGIQHPEYPQGEKYAVGEYYPAQNDLPLIYGVGEAGLPASATVERQALARQLKGYLFLYEQIIAGVADQLSHINAFFSADPSLERTFFHQPLYHLTDSEYLLKSFHLQAAEQGDFESEWVSFMNDPDNGYISMLRNSAESAEQFLTRRNHIFDHLLAGFGENLRDRTNFLLRSAESPEELNETMRELINEKSDFIGELPLLNRDRSQAFGNPVWRWPDLLNLHQGPEGVQWVITDSELLPLFRSTEPAIMENQAKRLAAEALSLAVNEKYYSILEQAPGQHRLIISAHAAAEAIAESETVYSTHAQAENAREETVEKVLDLWTKFALIPLEKRLYHLLGMERSGRRTPEQLSEDDHGFYMIEHHLLYSDSEMTLPLSILGRDDPYSFQVTFVFPSGYARNFSDADAEKELTGGADNQNRDPEYRRFAELQIRKACPAHILPSILWVDRTLEGSPSQPEDPAFENFETRFLAWLDAWFTDENDALLPGNELVDIMNAIYQEAENS